MQANGFLARLQVRCPKLDGHPLQRVEGLCGRHTGETFCVAFEGVRGAALFARLRSPSFRTRVATPRDPPTPARQSLGKVATRVPIPPSLPNLLFAGPEAAPLRLDSRGEEDQFLSLPELCLPPPSEAALLSKGERSTSWAFGQRRGLKYSVTPGRGRQLEEGGRPARNFFFWGASTPPPPQEAVN